MDNSNLKQKTISGVSWSLTEQLLSRGVNFVIGIILARLLTPADYGLIGMLGIFLAISQLFIDGGLTSALIRQKNPSEKDYSTVYIINITLSFVFYALLFTIAPSIANFYNQPLLKPLLRVLALTFVIGSLSSIQGTLLSIQINFRTKTYISLLSSVISGTLGIICAFKGLGVWSLVAQSLSSSIAVTVITLLFVRWIPKLQFSKESFNRLFSFSSKILTASLISTIYDNAYPMVIGKKFSASDVGLYTRASQFPGIANGTITGAFNRVAFPVLSKIQEDNTRLLSVYEKYLQLLCFIIFPILLGLCGCAKPLVSLLLTDKWIDCVPLMQIICFGLLTNGITVINLNLLYVKGRSDYVLKLEIIKKCIAFTILLITLFFSVKVMCYGQVLYGFIAMYLNTYYTKKILGYPITKQLKSIYPYFIISLIILWESLFFSQTIHNNILSVLASITVGVTLYLLINKAFGLYAYKEIMSLAKSYLTRQ